MRICVQASAPVSPGYCPELDSTPELIPVGSSYFQSLIGILRWDVYPGRI